MPELPEVETTRRGIEPWVSGQTITRCTVRNANLRWPVDLPDHLEGTIVPSVTRRGKYLILTTRSLVPQKAHESSGSIIIHLGMSGSLRVMTPGTTPLKHDHVDIEFANGRLLRLNDPRRFGCVLYHPGDDPETHPLLAGIGVEPLGNEFSGEYLFGQSRGRKLAVKNFIMDSRVVAGVGNIYAAEALFMAGIRPATAAGRIPLRAYNRLASSVVEVLARSVREGGTTLRDFVGSDGTPGYFRQRLNVYGREGKPCRVCATVLKLKRIGQRSSVYCPQCQRSSGFTE